MRPLIVGLVLCAAFTSHTTAQPIDVPEHTLVVNADLGAVTINRHIYGHFAEHLGRGIYDGFWAADAQGNRYLRDDVIEALRRIRIPNVRWPGGCFADYYHWKDGIGPREDRPTVVNALWGGVTEDNSFGTHEFMELVDRLGTEPVVVGNVGSGTVEEMSKWWEYMNHPGSSPMADLRASNGHPEPWNVRFWGVGNESWGCGGNMTPEHYADVYKRFATYLHRYGGVRPFRIATGPSGGDYRWTEVLMREAGRMIDGIDLHHYTVRNWSDKGSATDFSEVDWITAMRNAMRVDELITRHSAIMDQYDPEKRVWLIVGEWGMWHDVEPGTNPGFLYQQNTMRDALVAAVSLDAFNQHADRVKMANIAQTINVLQAMILTEGDRMLLTPTYHVFDLYKEHQDATLLPINLDRGTYTHGDESIPALSASASRDDSGAIHLTLSNLDPNQERVVRMEVRGQETSRLEGRILTAPEMQTHNTFDRPDALRPVAFDDAGLSDGVWTIRVPAKAVVALRVE